MLGTGELLLIAVVAIIVVDPKKLPDLMKGLGKAIGEFKQMSSEFKHTIESEAESADFEKRKAEAHEKLYGSGAKTGAEGEPAPGETPAGEHPAGETPAGDQAVEQPPFVEQPPVERAAELAAADQAATEQPVADQAATEPVTETVTAPISEPVAETPAPPAAAEMPAPPILPEEPAPPAPPAPIEEAAPPAPVEESAPPLPVEEVALPIPAEEAALPADAPPPPPPPPTGDDAVGEGHSGRMSLFGHLQDLRVRLTRCAIGVVVGFLFCYAFAGRMLHILMKPMLDALKQSHFIYTIPTEAFFVEMKVAFVAGIFLASPYLFYQLWQFVSPGLYSHERRWIIPIAFFSALCFTTGAMFGYFVVFPFGFEFFASYASDTLQFTPKLDEYLDFVLKLLFAFGIVFELPLFLFFLARLGIVTHVGLRKKRKYAVLVAFIVSAALTPPDAVSQTMMAVPLCILYEVGIWVAYFFGKKPKPKAEDQDAKPEAAA